MIAVQFDALLRFKELLLLKRLADPAWLGTRRVRTEVVRTWKGLDPLIDWVTAHVGAP